MAFLAKRKLRPSRIGTNEPVDSCVIFVHGLAGSIYTWWTFSDHLQRYWDRDESFGIEYDQYTVELRLPLIDTIYKAFKGGPEINILAEGFKTAIEQVCREYDNIIIVAHSMGGLVARQYLVNIVKDTKETGKVRGLITYATPHRGSIIASYYKLLWIKHLLFPFYSISKQVNQMCRFESVFIDKLNEDWDNLRIEKQIEFNRVVGELDFFVDRESAALNWDPFCHSIPNKGHFDIIKPGRIKDPAFLVTFNYLKEFRGKLEKKMEEAQDDINFDAEEDEQE